MVLHLTNVVTMDFSANTLLALGGSPLMSEAGDELVRLSLAYYNDCGTLAASKTIGPGSYRTASCGAVVSLDRLGMGVLYEKECKKLALNPVLTALTGGEDYSLLLTVKKSSAEYIEREFSDMFSYPLKLVGCATHGQGASLCKNRQTGVVL